MNTRTVHIIIGAMVWFGTLALALIAVLSWRQKPVPDGLWTLAGGPIVGLPSLLASLKTTTEPQAVEVVNTMADPVPTEDA